MTARSDSLAIPADHAYACKVQFRAWEENGDDEESETGARGEKSANATENGKRKRIRDRRRKSQ